MKSPLSASECYRSLALACAFAAATASPAHAQTAPLDPSGQFSVYESGAARTPPMGWNPWNAFRTDVDEAKVRASAQALVATGLAAKGYRFVNIDDGWALKRLPDGRLRIRDSMFPSSRTGSDTGSFLPFTSFLHGLGLKAGLYTDIGRNTCAQAWDGDSRNLPEGSTAERQVGSYGHAEQDMRTTFADWKFDYVKIDACGVADYTPADPTVKSGRYQPFAPPLIVRGAIARSDPAAVEALYARLGAAIRRFGGDDATFSICAWGEALSPLWGHRHGNLWRTSPDVEFTWKSMLGNFDSVVDGALYAGPGHWNDPDMLAVGHGDFDVHHLTEARSHVTMWAIAAAPLLLGFDLRGAPPALLDLVGNSEMIAIDQDAAGNQGVPYRDGDAMAVVRTLSAPGARAVALLNRGERSVTARVTWAQMGFATGSRAAVRDVWAKADRAAATDAITATLPPHGSLLLRVTGTPADPAILPIEQMPARVNIAADGLTPATALAVGAFPARIGVAPDGTPLAIKGRSGVRGIGLFANSRVEVRADGTFRRFTATPLVIGSGKAVRFRVYADRRLVQEVAVTRGQPMGPIDADVTGARIVELVALADAAPGRPPMIGWGDAALRR